MVAYYGKQFPILLPHYVILPSQHIKKQTVINPNFNSLIPIITGAYYEPPQGQWAVHTLAQRSPLPHLALLCFAKDFELKTINNKKA